MSKVIRLILALVLVGAAFFGEQIVSIIKNNVEIVNTPSVNIPEPSLEYRTLVEDIVSLDIAREDAKQISDFFIEVSGIVWHDPGFIETTGVFREVNVTSGGLHF